MPEKLEKQMRRSQILDAARKLLFTHGIENVSISKISREAELGVGTIYFYYGSKEDIFIALQKEGLSILSSLVCQITKKTISPDDKLRQVAWVYYDFSESQAEYYNIINYFLSSPKVFFKADLKQQVDMSGGRILRKIQDVIEEGRNEHVFRENDPVKFSIMFWGTLHGLIQFKKMTPETLGNQNHRAIYEYSVEKLIRALLSDQRKVK